MCYTQEAGSFDFPKKLKTFSSTPLHKLSQWVTQHGTVFNGITVYE